MLNFFFINFSYEFLALKERLKCQNFAGQIHKTFNVYCLLLDRKLFLKALANILSIHLLVGINGPFIIYTLSVMLRFQLAPSQFCDISSIKLSLHTP